MTEKFIVCGVPRSGTTALAHLLNTHPNVFCGIERFPIDQLNRKLLCPAGVLDRSIPTAHYKRNVKILNSKPNIMAFGDKTPRYYFSSRRLSTDFPSLKRILIIRQTADVMSSWQTRADNFDDSAWHRGQHGIFALIDQLVLLDSLVKLEKPSDCFLCSYSGMFGSNRNKDASRELFSFLGVDYLSGVEVFFDQTRDLRRKLAKKTSVINSSNHDLAVQLGFDRLKQLVDAQNGFVNLGDCKDQIIELSHTIPGCLPSLTDLIDRRLTESPHALSYLIQVLKRMYTIDRQNLFFTSDRAKYSDGFRTSVDYVEASVEADLPTAIDHAKRLRYKFTTSDFGIPELGHASKRIAKPQSKAILKNTIVGFIDSITRKSVTGWVAHRDSSSRVSVELHIDGEPLQIRMANLPRPGLKSRGIHQTGNCGFRFDIDREVYRNQKVEVVVLPGGQQLGMHENTSDLRGVKPTPELRLFFIHVPKTAGSSLNDFIASHFSEDRVKIHIEGSSYRDNPKFTKECDYISGHIKATDAKRWLNLDGFQWITLFRDPWKQLASHLCWARFIGRDPQSAFFKGHPDQIRDLALKLKSIDFSNADQLEKLLYSDDHRVATLFDNFQTRALVDIIPGKKMTRDDLDVAIKRLDWFKVLGTTEDYDGFIERLCTFTSWDKPEKPKRLNTQPDRFGLNINDIATKTVLTPLVQYDLELYTLVRNITTIEN